MDVADQAIAMVFRLIKELATSEDARREFWDQFMDSAAGHFIAADSLNSWAKQAKNSAGDSPIAPKVDGPSRIG